MTTPPEGQPPPPGPYGDPGQYGTTGQYGPPGGQGSPGGYGGPPPDQGPGTDVVSVVGLVLAFLLAPVGLVVSIVGLVRTSGGRRKGRGLAIAGVVVSVLVMAAAVVAAVALTAYVVDATSSAVEELRESLPTADPFPTTEPFPTVEPFPTADPFPTAELTAESSGNPSPQGRYLVVPGAVAGTSPQEQSIDLGIDMRYVGSAGGSVLAASTGTGAEAGWQDR